MLIWIVGIVSSLGLVGTIAAAIAFPAVVIPILQSLVAALLKCRTCLALLAAIALLFVGALYGVHVEKARSEARLEKARTEAAAAAEQRDVEVRTDLEKSYAPAISALRALNVSLQDKVKDYETRKPATPGKPAAAGCKLGDAAGVLQPAPASGPAGAAPGRPAANLRKHPGAGAGARRSSGG